MEGDRSDPLMLRGVKGQKKGSAARVITIHQRFQNSDGEVWITISDDWEIITNGPKQVKISKITKEHGRVNHSIPHRQDHDRFWDGASIQIVFPQDQTTMDQIQWIMQNIEIHEHHQIIEWRSRGEQTGDKSGFWRKRIDDLRRMKTDAPTPKCVWIDNAHHDLIDWTATDFYDLPKPAWVKAAEDVLDDDE